MSGDPQLTGDILHFQLNQADFSETGIIPLPAFPNGSLGPFVLTQTQVKTQSTLTATGARTDASAAVITMFSIDDLVFLSFFPKALATPSNSLSTTSIIFPAAVPAQFRPGNNVRFNSSGTANSVEGIFKFLIGTNGNITIEQLASANFTSGQPCSVSGSVYCSYSKTTL
jgi:hypothetical protein